MQQSVFVRIVYVCILLPNFSWLNNNFLSAVFSYLLAPTKKHEKKGGKADAGKDKHAHVW